MKKLSEVKWEAFDIQEVFPEIKRGRRLKTEDHIPGCMPYVSSSAIDNGVDDFVSNKEGVRIFEDCISLANSGSVGASFYHPYQFVASDHVTKLKNPECNKYIYLFLSTITSRLSEKYSFNREINEGRLNREKILVPVSESGQPDYDFMEQYMKAIEKKLLKRYQQYLIETKCNSLTDKKLTGGGKIEWKEFDFVEIFEIKKGFYNKKPPHRQTGTVPFIGATDSNNGITSFTTIEDIKSHSKTGAMPNEPFEKKYFKGNCICVTNNGSVGNAYYQDTAFTCTHDVNPLYLKNRILTHHLAMYIIACIEKQKICFEYARKWRPCRMVKSRLMLPVASDGHPDYEYMEQYMRNQEQAIINRYLNYRLHNL